MGFLENRDGKFMYRCDKCAREFQFGPHTYDGATGPNETMLCNLCRGPRWKSVNSPDQK